MRTKNILEILQPRKKCFKIGINTISRENLQPDVGGEQAIEEPCFKCRYVVAMIGFLIFFYLNGIRINMSVGIVAMVNQSAMPQQTETTSVSCPVPLMNLTNRSENSENMYLGTGEFNWSPQIQGYILGSYYVIYVITQIPFGKLVERYGFKWFAFWGTFVTAVATLLVPMASRTHPYVLILMQLCAGVGQRPDPPWREIFSSVPFYALVLGYFGQTWAISHFMTVNSIFLGTILHYPIDENGFLTAVSFLLMFLFTLISSWLSSIMNSRKYATIDQVRKSCNFIGSLGVSLCLLGIYFSGCNKWWSSTLAVLSVGFIGVGFSGVWIVSTDMSPNFAASINSVSCTFGCLPTFILPFIVGYVTNESQTLEQWNIVFFIGIGVIMTFGLVFSIFGSAEVQPWNFVGDHQMKEEDKNSRYRY